MSSEAPILSPEGVPKAHPAPRVGVPYRTLNEQLANKRSAYEKYLRAIEQAGGKPVEIPLTLPADELDALAKSLDAIVLPGGPADVNPARYCAARRPETNDPDPAREQTDTALLDHAFSHGKPVLAICYGLQLLNVYLGGTLVQDIVSELEAPLQHHWKNRALEPEPYHAVRIEAGSHLRELAGAAGARVNSSHHQAICEPGRHLRIVARAPDDVIEAVEGTGDSQWVTGVQWHPERMEDPLAGALFRELIEQACAAMNR